MILPIEDTISGVVWHDINKNSANDAGEQGKEGIRVFIDANNNSEFDDGEVNTVTDSEGRYSFTGLDQTTYKVGIELDYGWQYTFPSESGSSAYASVNSNSKSDACYS